MSYNDTQAGRRIANLLTTNHVVVLPVSSLLVLFTLYGIYIVIFVLSIHVLTRHQKASKLYLWSSVALFSLDTVFVIGYTIQTLREQLFDYEAAQTGNWNHLLDDTYSDRMIIAPGMTWFIASDCMNAVADCTLIHRCYVVWSKRKRILYPLVAASVVINGMALGTDITVEAAYSARGGVGGKANEINNGAWVAAAAFNFTLTLMTAGRIWWTSRDARKRMGKVNSRYTRIVAMIIESGFLYSASLLGLYVTMLVKAEIPVPFDPSVIVIHLSGLAPTLLIVRVAYNTTVNQNPMISALNFPSTHPEMEGP